MSATIGDDSAIVRTFDADYKLISKPITSTSLAGISERMIIAPELMKRDLENIPETVARLAQWAASKRNIGTVILVPSSYAAQFWTNIADYADTSEKVADSVKKLQEGKSKGPFVFANRYDGIDLPGESCRLLILPGLPRGTNEYDQFLSSTFNQAKGINSAIAQRIEQGMGRAARGPGDYCVVIITGKDLIAWIGLSINLKFLTSSTSAQLEMGLDISKNVKDIRSLAETIDACFNRDKEWTRYHAETLAESVVPEKVDLQSLKEADIERKAFRLWRDGYCEKAIIRLEKNCQEITGIDNQWKGWLLQMAARIAYNWGNKEKAQKLQQEAYSCNRYLLRPQIIPPYVNLPRPTKQAKVIIEEICRFAHRKGFIAEFDEVVSHLVPEATANQFESSLERLGSMLGFSAERPEKVYGIGPDLLWLLNDKLGLVIEAKSRKYGNNPLTKSQHGQLLVAIEWFKKQYPDYLYVSVSVHPNKTATKSAVADGTKALTYQNLYKLISDARMLFIKLCESIREKPELTDLCTKLLSESKLNTKGFIQEYLLPFELE